MDGANCGGKFPIEGYAVEQAGRDVVFGGVGCGGGGGGGGGGGACVVGGVGACSLAVSIPIPASIPAMNPSIPAPNITSITPGPIAIAAGIAASAIIIVSMYRITATFTSVEPYSFANCHRHTSCSIPKITRNIAAIINAIIAPALAASACAIACGFPIAANIIEAPTAIATIMRMNAIIPRSPVAFHSPLSRSFPKVYQPIATSITPMMLTYGIAARIYPMPKSVLPKSLYTEAFIL